MILVLALALSLAACGGVAPQQPETTAIPTEAPSAGGDSQPTPEPAAPSATPDAQPTEQPADPLMQALLQTLPSIKQDASHDWRYAITDLDHNGRVEVLVASQHQADRSTTVKLWELSEKMDSLVECSTKLEEGESFPDLLSDNADTYYDPATGAWSYLFYDNILLSEVSLRFAAQGIAMVHNLICGSLTAVGEATDSIVDGVLRQRFTPYHIPHRTEVCGFMTILHGDDRFYNNIFIQKYPAESQALLRDSSEGVDYDNREVGTHVFDEYPTYEEWIPHFDMDTDTPDMKKLEPYHWSYLPVWAEGNAYFDGAKAWKKEKGNLVDTENQVTVELTEKDGKPVLQTNVYDFLKEFRCQMIHTDTLGKAFEPEQRYENPDGTDIHFDVDYLGNHRGTEVLPGPFASAEDAGAVLWMGL